MIFTAHYLILKNLFYLITTLMKYLEQSKENKYKNLLTKTNAYSISPRTKEMRNFPSLKSDKYQKANSDKKLIKFNKNKNSVYSPFVIKKNDEFKDHKLLLKKKLNFDSLEKNAENPTNATINNNNEFKARINISDNSIYDSYLISENQRSIFSTCQETFGNTQKISNFISSANKTNNIYSPSPEDNLVKIRRYSDRFIPVNKGQNLLEKFESIDKSTFLQNPKKNNLINTDTSNTQAAETPANSINTNNCANGRNGEKYKNNFFSRFDNENTQKKNYEGLLQSNLFNYNKTPKRNNFIFEDNNVDEQNSTIKENYCFSSGNKLEKSFSEDRKIKSKLFEFKDELLKNDNFDLRKKLNFNCDLNLNIGKIEGEITRKVNSKPYRILDAPGLSDDFYLNLLDWSSRDIIALGLENNVFLWCCKKMQAYNLLNYPILNNKQKYVTSLIWNNSGNELAVGNSEGYVEIWDSKY